MTDEPTFDPQRRNAIRDLVVTTARTSSPRRGRGIRAAVIAALVLSAVSVSGGVAYALSAGLLEPSPVASVAPAPTETPSPTPASPTPAVTRSAAPSTAPEDAADPGTWIIGFDGVGPVKLGPSLEDQRRVLPSFVDITDPLCVGSYLNLKAPNGYSILLVSGPDKPAATAAITFGDDSGATSDERATTPKTTAGIGIGSTREELLAAYPGIQQTGSYQSDDEDPYYGLTDGDGGWIVFGISQGTVGTIQVANEATLPNENVSVKTLPAERCPA